MKKKVIFVLMCMCFFAGLPAGIYAQENGDHLYVYAPDGQEKPFALDNIRKITFSDEAMSVIPENGAAEQISYDDIGKLTFEPQLITDIMVIETNSCIIVYITDGNLFVESQEELTAVSLYNMQGRQLQNVTPRSQSAVLPLQSVPAGIYLVRILNQSGVHTFKIINK